MRLFASFLPGASLNETISGDFSGAFSGVGLYEVHHL
jgi:hypothetical protein